MDQTVLQQAIGARAYALFAHALVASALLIAIATSARAQTAEGLPFGLIAESQFASRIAGEVEPLWNVSAAPPRVKRDEFKGVGGVKLAYAAVVVPNERAAIVIVTGRTENLLKYQEVVADLVRQKYSVYVYDHRGQGFSERLIKDAREKGHVKKFDDYVNDLQTFVLDVVKKEQHKKLLVLAHSMGGGVATRHLQMFPGTFDAAALSSPMHQPNATILFSADSSCKYFESAVWFLGEWWAGGKESLYSHGPYVEATNEYTHSDVRWERVLKVENQYPEVRLGGPTRRWVSQACIASDAMLSETAKIITPVLVLQASEDTAVTPAAHAKFCSELAKNTGRPCEGGGPQIIEGARHELLIEADRYRVPAVSKILDFYAKILSETQGR
jgi:lysophospholipase